jgi:glucose-6-phosphate isomerase
MLPEVSKLLSDLGLESKKVVAQSMSAAFAADPERFTRFHVLLDDVLYDYSKQRITPEVLAVLVDLAKAAGVEARRDAMFSGAIVNVTEKRAALHTALRDFSGRKLTVEGRDVGAEVEAERGRMLAFA